MYWKVSVYYFQMSEKLRRLQFPEGIFYEAKNNRYLTRKTNRFIELVSCLSSGCEGIKKEDSSNFDEKSSLVHLNGELSNLLVVDFLGFIEIV